MENLSNEELLSINGGEQGKEKFGLESAMVLLDGMVAGATGVIAALLEF